jgi:hypothetical protein
VEEDQRRRSEGEWIESIAGLVVAIEGGEGRGRKTEKRENDHMR